MHARGSGVYAGHVSVHHAIHRRTDLGLVARPCVGPLIRKPRLAPERNRIGAAV
jgi:hypothetical protein